MSMENDSRINLCIPVWVITTNFDVFKYKLKALDIEAYSKPCQISQIESR